MTTPTNRRPNPYKMVVGYAIILFLGMLAGDASPWPVSDARYWLWVFPCAFLIGVTGWHFLMKWAKDN